MQLLKPANSQSFNSKVGKFHNCKFQRFFLNFHSTNFHNTMYAIVVFLFLALAFRILYYYHGRSIHNRFLCWYFVYSSAVHHAHKCSWEERKELFGEMQNQVSHDPLLRNAGRIRILELGVAKGVNCCLYPKDCLLVALDPNELFIPHLKKTISKLDAVHLERFVVAKAENMETIADGSIDVVVSTDVLCSVDCVDRSLSEIQRVLAKGGKYYFMNHMAAPEGTKVRFAQILASYIWKWVFLCNVVGEYEGSLEKAGFGSVQIRNVRFDMGTGLLVPLVSYYVIGTAIK